MSSFASRRALWCAATGGLLCLAVPAFAHTPLLTTVPADGATVVAPAMVALEFGQAVRLAKLTVTPPGGKAVALDLAEHKTFAARHDVRAGGLTTAGEHLVLWRALARDGHVMKGQFSFTVR